MARCEKCGRSEKEVNLIDAIFQGEVTNLCEECAKKEGIPVIKKPTTRQLKESEKKKGVYDRLKKISGYKDEKDKVREVSERISKVTDKDREQPEREMTEKEKQNINLIDNYNWYISMARKKKKITRGKLAKEIGESETAIKMIENKQLPEDALKLIKKIEQYFGIDLREGNGREERKQRRKRLERVRERAEINKYGKKEDRKIKSKEVSGRNDKDFIKIDRKTSKDITIDDLRKKTKKIKQDSGQKDKGKKTAAEKKAQDLIRQVEEEKKEKEKLRKEKAKKIPRQKDSSMLGEIDLDEIENL